MCCDGFALLLAQAQFEAQFEAQLEQSRNDHDLQAMVPVPLALSKVERVVRRPTKPLGAFAAGFAACIEWTERRLAVSVSAHVPPRKTA